MKVAFTNRIAATTVSGRLFSLLIFVVICAVLWIHHPLLYNADGYEYFVQGFDPLNNLNPHHVLWIPLVWSVITFARWIHVDPSTAVQFFGVLATASAAVGTSSVMTRRPIGPSTLLVLILFVFLGPWLWLLSTQNQPYPLLILIASLLLVTLAPPEGAAISRRRLFLGMILVAGAIGLNEAALLWIPAIGFYLWAALEGRKTQWRVAGWCSGVGMIVISYYVWAIAIQGFRTRADLAGWLTEYLHDQHPIQFHVGTALLQSAIGLTKVFFQTGSIDAHLFSRFSAPTIACFYAIGFVGVVGMLWRCRRRSVSDVWSYRHDRSLKLSVALLASWSVFCLLWEPNNYYWCVVLCPFLYVLVSSVRVGPLAIVLLGLAMGWNAYACIQLERYDEQGAPSLLLPKLLTDLSPADRYVILYESRPRAVDYSLLADALADRHRANQVSLVDDFILPDRERSGWSIPFDEFLNDTRVHQGKVYAAVQLLTPDAYRLASGILASYDVEEVANLQPESIEREMSRVLARYQILPSDFHIGNDRFFEVVRTRSDH